MFFRRLNWNIVGWFRIVSAISYAVIFAGLVVMGVHWHDTGYAAAAGPLVHRRHRRHGEVRAQRPRRRRSQSALATIGVTDERRSTRSRNPATFPDSRWTIETQTDFGNDTATAVERARQPRAGRSFAVRDLHGRARRSRTSICSTRSKRWSSRSAIQFVYIAFRFGWNYIFGLVAIVALVRDSLMMIGIYAIADKRVDDAFLAAVLTVIGYSVMDTIVILDRIRENTKLMDGEPLREDRQHVDPADDDALGQHARDRRHHAGRAAGASAARRSRISPSRCWSASAPAAITRSSTRRRSS